MASSKRDFERFVAWLHLPAIEAPSNVRCPANLALAHIDALAQTSRQHSQRSIYLVGQARRLLASTPDGPPYIRAVAADGTWPWKRLRTMTIGPFRGFRTPEPFDLQRRVILFYGPNGSGQPSFCEALEHGLLGSVEEAESKRIDGRTYLANLHARRFEPPALRATDHQNRECAVAANPDTFRFCFIERNRIDAFSRIAARPPAQRTELIATSDGATVYVVDHEDDYDAKQMSGKLTVLNGADKSEAALKPAGGNRLEANGVKLGKGAKVVAAVTEGRKATTVHFTVR